MAVIGGTRSIEASIEAVWSLLSDVDSYPRWVDATDRILERQPGDLNEGYRYREYGGLPPFKGESTWTITEWSPKARQVHVGDDGFVTMDLEIGLSGDAQTDVSMALTMTPRWFVAPVFYLVWPLMMRSRAEKTMQKTLDHLKAELEGAS